MNNGNIPGDFVHLLIGRMEGACENQLKPSQRRPQLTDREKDPEGASRIAVQSILLGVLVSIPMGLGGVPFSKTCSRR
jgi:hypothetical protein